MIKITCQELYSVCQFLYENNNGKPITIEQIPSYYKQSPKTFRKYCPKNWKNNVPDYFRTIFKDLTQFSVLTRESSYWIGYLLADGCITNQALMLECQTNDKEILEKFCDFLEIRRDRITFGHNGKSNCLSMGINNFIETDFSSFSLIPNKSSKELFINQKILNNNDFFFSFLKGLFDGDETVHNYSKSLGISICGTSKNLLTQIKNKLQQELPTPSSCWLIEKNVPNKLPLFTLKIGTGKKHNNLQFLFEEFYKDNYIILQRKFQSFKNIL